MRLLGKNGNELPGTLYGKVLGAGAGNGKDFSIRFTSVSPEIDALLRGLTATSPGAEAAASSTKDSPQAMVKP
jgi:hypothetical protein